MLVDVICAGLYYDNRELLLNEHFRSAWLEDPNELPYVGNGDNRVPTIHVQDLARTCKLPHISTTTREQKTRGVRKERSKTVNERNQRRSKIRRN